MFKPKKNVYVGVGDRQNIEYDITLNGETFDPAPSLKIRNHSPTGFAWGYGGSGPAQLALAILLEEFKKEIAERFYQDFKFEVIAGLPPQGEWRLDSRAIYEWMSNHLQTRYNAARKKLQELESGTQEWRDADHALQEAILALQEAILDIQDITDA
jgi:hypothetical protein